MGRLAGHLPVYGPRFLRHPDRDARAVAVPVLGCRDADCRRGLAGLFQHRLRHRPAARDRHSAADDLCRRHRGDHHHWLDGASVQRGPARAGADLRDAELRPAVVRSALCHSGARAAGCAAPRRQTPGGWHRCPARFGADRRQPGPRHPRGRGGELARAAIRPIGDWRACRGTRRRRP